MAYNPRLQKRIIQHALSGLMTMKRFALAVAALLAAATVHAQIYEWKDEKGKTHFSDKPPVGNSRATRTIEAQPSATGSSTQKTSADRELEYRARQKAAQENAELVKKEETTSADRKEACTSARRLLETLESGERVSLRDDKGERYYMDDGQREQESAKARQLMQSACKP
jgi:hypothetical protein